MSRPLRIEYPDAWYHVMNRGRRGEKVFSEKEDYDAFVELIKESVEMWNVRIAAYCLMPNHYHILIQTPDANLSRCMRHLNGVYTQRFNRSHRCDGQLFRGRYKSILVEADSYLLQLLRYIHRNPLKVGLADKLDRYSWSSHKGYLSDGKKWGWLYKDFILSMLTSDKGQRRRAYKQFISLEEPEEVNQIFERKKLPWALGSERFINWVKDKFFDEKHHKEIPESRALAPEVERIKEVVSKAYRVNKNELLKSKRGLFNEPRNVAIYLTRVLRSAPLVEICEEFGMNRYSSASSSLQGPQTQMSRDRQLRKRVERLRSQITNGQT
ncbi:MAG: transposase [Desulfobacterales bacterium]|nr:transposase [Desulfobacterales bacterium]